MVRGEHGLAEELRPWQESCAPALPDGPMSGAMRGPMGDPMSGPMGRPMGGPMGGPRSHVILFWSCAGPGREGPR